MSARFAATSDVLRVRRVFVAAALAAVVVALVAVAAPAGRLGSPGPLACPHLVAGVTCEGCHGPRVDGPAPEKACLGCHAAHPSTRAGHRALAARGVLGCPTCHQAHGAAQGVTFDDRGDAIRWWADAERRVPANGPAGATVALVPLAVCAGCHTTRADDPVRACTASDASATLSMCFDEHQRPEESLPPRGRCAQQHGPARFVAWQAARAVADRSPPGAPSVGHGPAPWLWLGSGVGTGALAFAGLAAARRIGRRRRIAAAQVAIAPTRVRLPRIDAVRCLGCQACVDACPFDVLAVERHVAVVARPDECCGVAACENACPNGSLRLADEGEPIGDRPRVDGELQSVDTPGVFVAGDLTGVPLIRNAILQGKRVAEHVASGLPRSRRASRDGERVDLVVVGAGPAGLSAALRAKELGLACVVLEQSTTAASIRDFPRGKIVHDPPIELPLEGPLWLRESTKEELVGQWTRIVRAHRLDVRERHRVTGVSGSAGDFVVAAETPDGTRRLRASRVLMAIGRRGTPRRLDAEIAAAAVTHVVHALSDARAFAGKRVLVVGLGDSAMEAVLALARQRGTTVTVSYRGTGFVRGRARNIDEVRRLAASGRVRIVFESRVRRIDVGRAVVETPGAVENLPVDAVLALLGGEPSRGLLEASGVSVEPP